jgi:hypothetical protein
MECCEKLSQVFNVGFGCLGFPVAAEMMPDTLRSRGLSFVTFAAGVFGFLNSKSYLDMGPTL